MGTVLTPALTVSAGTTVRRIRELPVPGEILVAQGDRVEAQDIVGRAELPGELYILRLPERMGLEVVEVLNGLRVKEGAKVKRGEVLCEHRGLFGLLRTAFEAPEDGTVELISKRTGHLGLRLKAQPIQIDAYISGKVVQVEKGKSVTIESRAAFIQGIFGVGGERKGPLKLLEVKEDKALTESDIPDSIRGSILVGGSHPTEEALNKAAELGAVGLVTGAIDDKVLASYLGFDLGIALTGDEDLPLSVIVTEGFGALPISPHVFKVLEKHDGKLASINGATQVRAGALRPEVIIALNAEDAEQNERSPSQSLEPGALIRCIRVPYFGKRGYITELPHEAQEIASGAKARVLKAKLEDGTEVTVPRANVELLAE